MAYVSAAGEGAIEPLVCSCGCVTRRQRIPVDGYGLVAVHCDHCGVIGWRWSVGGTRVSSRPHEQAA